MYVADIQVFKYFSLHIIILCKKYAIYKVLIFRYLKLFLIFFLHISLHVFGICTILSYLCIAIGKEVQRYT